MVNNILNKIKRAVNNYAFAKFGRNDYYLVFAFLNKSLIKEKYVIVL